MPKTQSLSYQSVVIGVIAACVTLLVAQFLFGIPVQPSVGIGIIGVVGLIALTLVYLLNSVIEASENDPSSLRVVASCVDQFEATALVTRLSDELIYAKPVGGYTSGFQVEAPGEVKVVVRKMDFERAQKIVNEVRTESDASDE